MFIGLRIVQSIFFYETEIYSEPHTAPTLAIFLIQSYVHTNLQTITTSPC
jgi:hypothetical protein